MTSKGFTLVEVMITMAIMAIIVALTVPIYTSNVKDVGFVSASVDTKIDNLLSAEIIRLDLQHVGTGLGLNETALPIIYDETNLFAPILDLRSTLVSTNQDTFGWGIVDCQNAGSSITTAPNDWVVDERGDNTIIEMVFLDASKNYAGNTFGAGNNCPGLGVYTVFPTIVGGANSCNTGFCSNVNYSLSGAQLLETCALGTRNLLRAVDGGVGEPIINCVAGMRVRFDLETGANPNGPDVFDTINIPGTALGIMNQVKNIDLYLMVQVGQRDPKLNSAPNLIINDAGGNVVVNFSSVLEDVNGDGAPDGGDGDWDNITNARNYHWKVIKISAKPDSWL